MMTMTIVKKIVILSFLAQFLTSSHCQENSIRNLQNGYLDWERLTVTVCGKAMPKTGLNPVKQRIDAVSESQTDAFNRMIRMIGQITYDSDMTVEMMLKESNIDLENLDISLSKFMRFSKPRIMPDNSIISKAEFNLTGELLKAILPSTETMFHEFFLLPSVNKHESSFTGVLFDCRGTGINFALCPSVLDSRNVELYGSGWINRETAVESGILQYFKNRQDAIIRVGDNPLIIKGKKTFGENNCDIIIRDMDIMKLFSSEYTINLINHGRAAFLVD